MRHGSHTEVIISYSLFQVFFTASDLIIRPLRQQDSDWFWSFVGLHAGSPVLALKALSQHTQEEMKPNQLAVCCVLHQSVWCFVLSKGGRLRSSLPECADGSSGKCWNAAVENETRGDGRAISRAVSVCLHVRERREMCVGGCEWVFAACVSGAPTAHSSSPRSLISSRLTWAQHIIRKQHGNTLMWLSSFISSLLRSFDLIR